MINGVRRVGSMAVLAALAACSGGGGSSSDDLGIVEPPPIAAASQSLLIPVVDSKSLSSSLRRGLAGTGYIVNSEPPVIALALGDLVASPSPEAGAGTGFSTTNLQEVGVDEADIVRYDGEILYVLDPGQALISPLLDPTPLVSTSLTPAKPREEIIRLLATDPASATAEQVSEIVLPQSEYSVEGLYLAQNNQGKQLITVEENTSYVYWELFADDYYWRNGRTRVQSWDVSDAASPAAAWSLEVDGSLLASRRIDNILYLVTRYSPVIEGLSAYPQSDEEVSANQTLIEEASLASLMPDVVFDGGAPQELLSPTDCYVPNSEIHGPDILPAGGSLITVTAINLDAPQSINSTCIHAPVTGFYASPQSIYLTAGLGSGTTLIHKIALSGSTSEYRGSGEVRGFIGAGNPAFSMSEVAGDLRVVSSSWDESFVPFLLIDTTEDTQASSSLTEDDGFGRHRLTILRESADGDELERVSQLPNAERPEHIGKPGEDVYAVRFVGERAYIVTFEVIDPLYVLDLSDISDPKIAGELEIPGFSTLLQPVGDNLLLGIGHEVADDGQSLTQGVKLALFDVADPSAPVSLSEIVIGKRGSHAPALYDHHALTLLAVDGGFRAALTIERNENTTGTDDQDILDPWYWYGWSDTGLYMFDIDPAQGSLVLSGTLITDQTSEEIPYPVADIYSRRSVIHDDAVFYIEGTQLWSQFWGLDF